MTESSKNIPDDKNVEQNQALEPLNPCFRWVIISCALFIMTIFAMSANVMGDENAPMTAFIDHYSGYALAIEFLAIIFFGIMALVIDRREIVTQQKEDAKKQSVKKSPAK